MDVINKKGRGRSASKKFKYTPDKSLLRLFVGYVAAQQKKNYTREEIMDCVKILRSKSNRNPTCFQSLVKDKLKHLLPILLAFKDDVNFTNSEGETIIHIFTKHYTNKKIFPQSDPSNERKVIEILLKRGASVDVVDITKNTPVHYAADNERTDLVQLMLNTFTKVNTADGYGRTVLYYLVRNYNEMPNNSNLEVIRALMSKGANPNLMDHCKISPFNFAVEHCLINILEIDEGGDDLRALHLAAFSAHDRVIETLLKHGADVDSRTAHDRWTPLHMIWVKRNDIAFVENTENDEDFSWVLGRLCASDECDTHDDDGMPFPQEASDERVSCLTLLIQAGANPNARDVAFKTPLHLATSDFTNRTLLVLLELGARVDVADRFDVSPLANVIEREGDDVRFDGVELLLRYGAGLGELDVPRGLCNSSLLREYLWLLGKIHWMPEDTRVFMGLSLADEWTKRLSWMEGNRERELEKLKSHYLTDAETSLYDFLLMDWRRRDILAEEVLSVDLESEYPLYHVVIENSCRQAINEKVILNLASQALSRIARFNIPDVCADMIFSSLRKPEMTGFIDVVDEFYL